MKNSLFFLLLVFSCKEKSGKNFVVERELQIDSTNVLIGKIGTSNGGFEFFDCFCTKSDSGINIVHYNNYGLGGQTLTILYNQEQFESSFESWTDYGKPPIHNFQNQFLILNNVSYILGDTLKGSIDSKGYSMNQNEKSRSSKFYVKGTFKCLIRDSTYNYKAYEDDLRQRWNRIKIEEFKLVAHSDSAFQLTELDLNNLKIDSIPIEVINFPNVEDLGLIGNNISYLDLNILRQLRKLKSIRLDNNDIQNLPANLKELARLENLNLGSNPVENVSSIYSISSLKELDLGLTKITEISDEVSKLRELKKLDLGFTSQLKKISPEVFNLPKLEEIQFPDHIDNLILEGTNLGNLKEVWCSFALLKNNEAVLKNLKNLQFIYVSYSYESSAKRKSEHSGRRRWLEKHFPNARITDFTSIKSKTAYNKQ